MHNCKCKECWICKKEAKIRSDIQALRDNRPWAIEQIDIILDAKEEFEQDYGVDLGWL